MTDENIDYDEVPKDLRRGCEECDGDGEIADADFGKRQCANCDGRGWELAPLHEILFELYDLREQVDQGPPRTYHGWIIKKDEPGFNTQYSAEIKVEDTWVEGMRSYRLVHIIDWWEAKVGSFEIEEKLGGLGAFKVYTVEEKK